jgi:hypothetical protein
VGGFKVQVQQRIINSGRDYLAESHGKVENKEHFPLFHGTTTAICLILFTIIVALGV